ncbi:MULTISPECIES: hypothetical protein [Bombella]|uniref:Uncharacterized protein n=2 Tax=Bombella TaxID=1654741 RepID=A0A1S8GQC4_9PROT|nr:MULTISPECIES: hypothetical protein [Bombella]MBA5725864.1 hypothetical protein [Bombella favorum]MCX8667670.1 hypothetical protein [Acetobacteraceae bacterium B3987]OOL18920.1 hypothetical protein AL01_04095 [Bombella intestini]
MSDTSVASEIGTAMRLKTVQQANEMRKAAMSEKAARVQLSSHRSNGAEASMQFDATGQVVPSAKGVRKNSATASFVNLLA